MTTEEKNKIWAGVAKTVSFLAFVAITPIWRGYVFCVLWGWFIVSTLGAPALSVPAAMGITALAHFGMGNQSTREAIDTLKARTPKKDAPSIWMLLWGSLSSSVVTLGIGWVIHKFM